jgi:hypothetical protein
MVSYLKRQSIDMDTVSASDDDPAKDNSRWRLEEPAVGARRRGE